MDEARRIRALAERFDRQLSEGQIQRLVGFARLLHTWNARINLTGARSVDTIVDEQFPDAFALDQMVPPGARLVDIGSGGGLPGLPFAILRPDVRLTLDEPRSRRRAFLATALRETGAVAALRRERAEEFPAGEFDVASARAVLPPGEWLVAGLRLVAPEPVGRVVLFLNEPSPWTLPPQVESVGEVNYQAGPARRRVVAARRLP